MATVQTKVYAKDKETFARLKSLKNTELLKVPVSAVPFCARAQHAFEKIGVTTLGDLVVRTKFQLLKVQNLGRNTVAQVEAYLDVLGLRLGMRPELEAVGDDFDIEDEAVEVPYTPLEETPAPVVAPDLRAMLAEAQKATAEALKLNERMVAIIEKMAAGGAR